MLELNVNFAAACSCPCRGAVASSLHLEETKLQLYELSIAAAARSTAHSSHIGTSKKRNRHTTYL